MAIRSTHIIEPIKKLIKPGENITSPGSSTVKKETIKDKWNQGETDEFGGKGVQLIYDEDDNLIEVIGEKNDIKLYYDDEHDGDLDHVDQTFPGTEFSGVMKTSLDYDEKRRLEFAYTEIIE